MNKYNYINIMSVNKFGLNDDRSDIASNKYVDSKFITLTKHMQSKADKAGDILTGDLNMGSNSITNLKDPVNDNDAVNKKIVDQRLNLMNEYLNNVSCPINPKDVVNKMYVDEKLRSMTENVDIKIRSIPDPINLTDAVNKMYVDKRFLDYDRKQHDKFSQTITLSNSGLIPNLAINNGKTGFTASASSELSNDFAACKVFSHNRNNTQWRVVDGVNNKFWISISCPHPVKIYRFHLRINENARFLKWRIEGSNDSENWFRLPFHTDLEYSDELKKYSVSDLREIKEYDNYRIVVDEAAGSNIGLTYWQLFTINHVYTLN